VTTTVEGVEELPLGEVEDRLRDEFIAFWAAKEAGDSDGMREHYTTASALATRRDALTASATPAVPAVTAAGASPAVETVVLRSGVVSTDQPRNDHVDEGWSERCNACRYSFHDPRVKLVAVRASGVVVKLCPACRERHPGLQPA